MVDLTFLESFTKGNQEKMHRYIGMYLQIAPETFGKMQQYFLDQNWEQLRIQAHSLKPQAEFMGISGLKEILIEIEDTINAGIIDPLEDLLGQAQALHDKAMPLLKESLE